MSKKEKKLYGDYGIGEVLKKLRQNKKLTQAKLAEKLGVSINAVKQYEGNKREPQYDYLLKICDFFNISPDFLQSKKHYKNIVNDQMYFDYDKKNNSKTLRIKPLSEMEAYLLAEKNFDMYMAKLEYDLKNIFIANFKEDYPAYKNNFKRKLNYWSKENSKQ